MLNNEDDEITVDLKNDLDFISKSDLKCPGLDKPIDFYLKTFVNLGPKKDFEKDKDFKKLKKYLLIDL